MENSTLNTNTAAHNYSIPEKDEKTAVNIIINGVNTPGTYPGYSSYPTYSYPQPPSYYYNYQNYQYYNTQPNNNGLQQGISPVINKPLASNALTKSSMTESTSQTQTTTQPQNKKQITPVTDELLKRLSNELSKGDKPTRLHAVASTLKLLREDPENRKNDPRFADLINEALDTNQPGEVKEAALVAAENNLINATALKPEYLGNIANKHDKYGMDSLASLALDKRATAAQTLNPAATKLNSSTNQNTSAQGTRLNVISNRG